MRELRCLRSLSFLYLLLLLLVGVKGVQFEVSGHSKCLSEDIQLGVLVVGEYSVVEPSEDGNDKVSVKVTSPHGKELHFHDKAGGGIFGFTTKESGQYMACFWLPQGSPGKLPIMVDLDLKIGVAARDWSAVAKKEKLDGLTLELMKLEGALDAIRNELTSYTDREASMRDLNEVTNSRVAYLSILSLFVCIGLAALQLWYLKTYFERKKLL